MDWMLPPWDVVTSFTHLSSCIKKERLSPDHVLTFGHCFQQHKLHKWTFHGPQQQLCQRNYNKVTNTVVPAEADSLWMWQMMGEGCVLIVTNTSSGVLESARLWCMEPLTNIWLLLLTLLEADWRSQADSVLLRGNREKMNVGCCQLC